MDGEARLKQLMSLISSNTQKISQNANQISGMLQLYDTPRDSIQHREKTLEIAKEASLLSKETYQKIKELSNYNQILSRDKQLKIQQERITEAFTKALKALQDREKEIAKKTPLSSFSKDNDVQMIEPRNSMKLIDIDSENDSNYPSASYNKSQQQAQISLDYDQVLAVEQQNEAFRDLEKDIVDVNSIFKDLAILVHDQGEVIDSIEKNIETTSIRVQDANVELGGALKYQSKARTKKCWCILILMIVLGVIGLIIYFSIPKK